MMYNFANYYNGTYGIWSICAIPQRKADYKSGSSKYWDCGDGVIRLSDHWGVVGSCFWRIDSFPMRGIFKERNCGFILYSDLREATKDQLKK